MKGVVGLGACVVDTLISTERFPTEDTKMPAGNILVTGGGPVANALVVMSKLGVETSVIGALAGDASGEFIRTDFERLGVRTDGVSIVEGASSFVSYIILSDTSGSRTCLYNRGTVKDDPSLVDLSVIDGASVLHLDGNYLESAICAAKYAKEQGVTVSLDAGGRYPGIERLLPLVDILIPSAEFALGITGEDDIPSAMRVLYEKYSPKILVVTDGARGGYYLDGDEIIHYDTHKIEPVDTNGAGDTFHGAFVAAYVKGMTTPEACRFASNVAAYKCTHKGARDYPLNMEIAEGLFK
jgi:sulfofructose kinase